MKHLPISFVFCLLIAVVTSIGKTKPKKQLNLELHHVEDMGDEFCYYYKISGRHTRNKSLKAIIYPSCSGNEPYNIDSNVLISECDVSIVHDELYGIGIQMTKINNKMAHFCINTTNTVIRNVINGKYCIYTTKHKMQCGDGLEVPDVCNIIHQETNEPTPYPTTMQPTNIPIGDPSTDPTIYSTLEPTNNLTNNSDEPMPGKNFSFDGGYFTLRNTTTIIRPHMIHNCSSNFVEVYKSEIELDRITIGSPLISLLKYINEMPNDCYVVYGAVETMHDSTQDIIHINLSKLRVNEVFTEANIAIDNDTAIIYKLVNKSDNSNRRRLGEREWVPGVFQKAFKFGMPKGFPETPGEKTEFGVTLKYGMSVWSHIIYELRLIEYDIIKHYLKVWLFPHAFIGIGLDPKVALKKEFDIDFVDFVDTYYVSIGGFPLKISPFIKAKWGFDIIALKYDVDAEWYGVAEVGFDYKRNRSPELKWINDYGQSIYITRNIANVVVIENEKKSCRFQPKLYVKPIIGVKLEWGLITATIPVEAGVQLNLQLPTQLCPDCTKEYQYGVDWYVNASLEVVLLDFADIVGDKYNHSITVPVPQIIPPWKSPLINPTCGDVNTFGNIVKAFLISTCCPTSNPTTSPTTDPTTDPTNSPSTDPTNSPSTDPTNSPSTDPTKVPTVTTIVPVSRANAIYHDLTMNATNSGFQHNGIFVLLFVFVSVVVIFVIYLVYQGHRQLNMVTVESYCDNNCNADHCDTE